MKTAKRIELDAFLTASFSNVSFRERRRYQLRQLLIIKKGKAIFKDRIVVLDLIAYN